MERAVHVCRYVKNFLLDSTALSLRKHRENEVWEWSFISQLYLATSQTPATAVCTAKLSGQKIDFGIEFSGPGPACEGSPILEKTLELMVKRRLSN